MPPTRRLRPPINVASSVIIGVAAPPIPPASGVLKVATSLFTVLAAVWLISPGTANPTQFSEFDQYWLTGAFVQVWFAADADCGAARMPASSRAPNETPETMFVRVGFALVLVFMGF